MKYRRVWAVLASSLVAYTANGSPGQPDTPIHVIAARKTRLIEKWRSHGHGMFLHFSMNTFTGNEHDGGTTPSRVYAPTNLDVDQWIRTARDAGMGYAVLTAKHTAGYCLWDSKVTWKGSEYIYDIATSSNPTDIVAEFVAACERYGLQAGLYYCLMDRHNAFPKPDQSMWAAGSLPEEYFGLVEDHISELVTRYPGVTYYWIDIPGLASRSQREQLYRIASAGGQNLVLFNHGWKPPEQLVISQVQRLAWPTDIINTEKFFPGAKPPRAASDITEVNAELYMQEPARFDPRQSFEGHEWELGYEHCVSIANYWFWHPDDGPVPLDELVRDYEMTRRIGGNVLLNVPPDNIGRLPEAHVRRLMELKAALPPAR